MTSTIRNNQNVTHCDASEDNYDVLALEHPLPYRAACLIGGGRSVSAVARELHIHRMTIYRWLKQFPWMRGVVRAFRKASIVECERTYDELTMRALGKLQEAMDYGGVSARFATTAILRGIPTLFKSLPRFCRSPRDPAPESFPWVPERTTIGQRRPDSPRTEPCTKLPDL